MYVVAINRKALIGYKQVEGTVGRLLMGRRRIKLYGKRETGRSALILFNGHQYTGAVSDGVAPGDTVRLFLFPDQAIYSSFPEGDVWDIDTQELPKDRILIKDARGASKAYISKYGTLALKLAASIVAGAILWFGVAPAIGAALFAGVALQSIWRVITSGPLMHLYKTDCRKLTYSGRYQV